jgi:hypothetical protein
LAARLLNVLNSQRLNSSFSWNDEGRRCLLRLPTLAEPDH